MGIEATGKVHTIFETKQISDKFRKREFVLELADNPKYPQVVLFQATGDRCESLDSIKVGDVVQVEFSLRGREWRSPSGEIKYFNTLDVWKVELKSAGAGGKHEGAPPSTRMNETAGYNSDESDIPFGSCAMEHEPSAIARSLREGV